MRIEVRRVLAASKSQALIRGQIMVVLVVVPLQAGIAIDCLLGAHEAQPWIAQRYAVLCMPARQHGARDFGGNAAQRCAGPGPAGHRVSNPGLAIGFIHVLDRHAADVIGQVVILRGSHRSRQVVDAQLLEAWQESLESLMRKNGLDQLSSPRRASPGDGAQHDSGEEGAVPVCNRAIGVIIGLRDVALGARALV